MTLGPQQARAALEGFVSQFLNVANLRAANAEPVFGFTESVAQTGASTNYFAFVLVGLIGMALMNSALQGIAIAMSRYRDAQILKRIVTTPLPAWKFVSAEVLSRLVLNLIQVTVILGIGMRVFHAHVSGSLFELVCLALAGAILFQLAGFAVASVSKTTEAAEGMSQAIAVPMMFLAGVFF